MTDTVKPRANRPPARMLRLERAPLIPPLLWSAFLMFQNATVVRASIDALQQVSGMPEFERKFAVFLGLGLFHFTLLLLAAGMVLLTRRPIRFAVLGLAILYVHPLGPFVGSLLTGLRPPSAGLFVSVSALLSYVSVAALALAWWLSRRTASPPLAE
jgi:hypothetical protein